MAPLPPHLSNLRLTLTKLVNRAKYEQLKAERKQLIFMEQLLEWNESAHFPHHPLPRPAFFRHSGNAGDLIYSLPALRSLAGEHPAHLRLRLDVPIMDRRIRAMHPLGGVMLDQGMFDRLKPLLDIQPYVASVAIDDGSPVNFDLDSFRRCPLPQDRLGICRWYFYALATTADLSVPWLHVPGDLSFKETVLIARSTRYRNPNIDYGFLAQYPNLRFVGLEPEYLEMKAKIPNLQYFAVRDFLEMANAIRSCRLFIGNQSFPFSLAEALKVRRVLEVDVLAPNVVPTGGEHHDAILQRQFETVVKRMLDPA